MSGAHSPQTTVLFGAFEADFRAGELRKRGIKIKLQEQPLRILQMLLEHPGEIVTREELRRSGRLTHSLTSNKAFTTPLGDFATR